MKDRLNNLNLECINLREVEVRIEVCLGQILLIKVVQYIIEILEVDWGLVQVIEADMVII